jgi:hypothetical protein
MVEEDKKTADADSGAPVMNVTEQLLKCYARLDEIESSTAPQAAKDLMKTSVQNNINDLLKQI